MFRVGSRHEENAKSHNQCRLHSEYQGSLRQKTLTQIRTVKGGKYTSDKECDEVAANDVARIGG